MTTEAENLRELALKDVIGEATDEESAWLRSDARVREWYACLKQLRQDHERELGEVRRAAKLTHRKDAYATKKDELGLEISEINGALSEARELVKDLNVRETAAQAKRKTPARSAAVPLPAEPEPPPSDASEALLRGDLRAARRLLRRCYDFMVDDAHITFRAMDARDALIEDLRRELRGT